MTIQRIAVGGGDGGDGGGASSVYYANCQWTLVQGTPSSIVLGYDIAVYQGSNPDDATAWLGGRLYRVPPASTQLVLTPDYPVGSRLNPYKFAIRDVFPWGTGPWTQYGSTSTATEPVYPIAGATDNLIPNATSERGLNRMGYDSILVVNDAPNSYNGSWCRKLDSSATNSTLISPILPCVYGDQFSFECQVKGTSATPQLQLVLTFFDTTGASLGTAATVAYAGSTSYQRLFVQGLTPVGAVSVQASVNASVTSAASFLYFDNLSLRRSVKFSHMEADAGFRGKNAVKNSGTSTSDMTWYGGSNDPNTNGGAPILVDKLWTLDGTYAVGQRIVAGSSASVPTYGTGIYVYICTAAGVGMTTALNGAGAWSSATTYAIGNTVKYTDNHSYTSLASGNLNNTPAIGGTSKWQDNGNVFGPQGTDPVNAVLDNAAQWKCIGWMFGNTSAAGCMPWARSTAYAVGALVCADPVTAAAYDAGMSKLYGPDPYITSPFDPVGLGTSSYAGKRIYRCITAGTSLGSGAGPTGTGASISDNTATWAYFGENTGPENRLQLWGGHATYGSTQGFADMEFRIIPKTNADNLDALTHILVEPRDSLGHTLGRSDGASFGEVAIGLPFTRAYGNPGTPGSAQNRIRLHHAFQSNQSLIFVNASPFGVDMKLRCRVFNVYGCSDAQDFVKWNNQNLAPCPYSLVSGTLAGGAPPGGGGGGGGGGCPEENVLVDLMVQQPDGSWLPSQKRAGDLVAGDIVWTIDAATGTIGHWPITDAVLEAATDLWKVTMVEDGMPSNLVFKNRHRFRTPNGWIEIQDLRSGDTILGTTGGTVLSVTPAPDANVVRITVDMAHTYQTSGLLSSNIKPN
jgi:hypothetical protein